MGVEVTYTSEFRSINIRYKFTYFYCFQLCLVNPSDVWNNFELFYCEKGIQVNSYGAVYYTRAAKANDFTLSPSYYFTLLHRFSLLLAKKCISNYLLFLFVVFIIISGAVWLLLTTFFAITWRTLFGIWQTCLKARKGLIQALAGLGRLKLIWQWLFMIVRSKFVESFWFNLIWNWKLLIWLLVQ